MLIGCEKLERLDICFERYLSLDYTGELEAGLVELLNGCPKLRNRVMRDCPFIKESFDLFMCSIMSKRYLRVEGKSQPCRNVLAKAHPNFVELQHDAIMDLCQH